MNASKIYNLEQTYASCSACVLCKHRIYNTHFGMGHPDGDILVVIPYPYMNWQEIPLSEKSLYDNSPMQMNSAERILFSKILSAVEIDKSRVYVVPAVMCSKGEETVPKEAVDACRDRLYQLIKIFQPRVLVLMGLISYYAYNNSKGDEVSHGIIYDENNKTIVYTYALDTYTKLKEKDPTSNQLQQLARNLFTQWKQISEIQ